MKKDASVAARATWFGIALSACALCACGSTSDGAGGAAFDAAAPRDSGAELPLGDAAPAVDGGWTQSDGGFVVADGGDVIRADRFVTKVVSFAPGDCAGWHAVYSNPSNGISPVDPARAGGDAFDLADVGLAHARFVRVRDKSRETCAPPNRPNNAGFDLDAIAIVNAEKM